MEENIDTQKYIICDFNEENAGKSQSLLKLIEIIENKGCKPLSVNQQTDNSGPDKYRCYDVPYNVKNIPSGRTIRIAVCTQGDPYSFQKMWLEQATTRDNAQVVICTSRVRRETVKIVYNYAGEEYKIIWLSGFCTDDYYSKKTHPYVQTISNRLNNATANSIFNAIEQLFKIQL